VDKILENMDRPYLKGIPGIHRDVTGGVKNYGPRGDIGFDSNYIDDTEYW